MTSIDDVTDLTPRVQYTASAAQTTFDYPFPIFADTDLVVDIDGTTKTLTTHYTVTDAGNDTGGTIVLVTAAAGGEIVTIYRQTAITRLTDFQQNGPLSSTSFNDQLDKLTVIAQELDAAIQRCLRIPTTAEVDDADIELPVANWANKYLTFDVNGKPTPAALSSSTMTQATIGNLLYPRTAAEQSAGVTPTNYQYVGFPTIEVERYGAVGDGITDDTQAVRDAMSVLAEYGGGTLVFGPRTYLLTSSGTHSVVVPVAGTNYTDDTQSMPYLVLLDGLSNIRWLGHGTTLKSTVTGGGCMFLLDDVRNFECHGINIESVTAHNASGTVTTSGMIGFGITSQTRDSFNFKFSNMTATNVYVAIYCFGSATSAYRVRGVMIDNLYHDKGMYTLAFHNNGDNVMASGVHSSDALREYFIYGVSNHTVQITSDTAVGGFASNIKAYDRDTTGIRYRLKTSKSSTAYNVNLESQHHVATQPTPCKLIDIELDIDNTEADAGNEVALYFGYFQDAALQATSSNQIWTGIKLKGIHRQCPVISTKQTGSLGAYGTLNTDELVLLAGSKTSLYAQTGFVDSKQDYATFTPVLKFGGSATGITYSANVGEFWRDGQFVEMLVDFTLSSKGAQTGTATIGLPYSSSSKSYLNAIVRGMGMSNVSGLTSVITGFVSTGGSTLTLQHQGATGVSNITDANFTNTSRILLHARYSIT